MESIKLDYATFGRILKSHCKGYIDTGKDVSGRIKPTQENIDKYILYPAAMSEQEELEYSGYFSKDVLSDYRRGVRSLPGYITDAFAKEDAVSLTKAHFEKLLSATVPIHERIPLLDAVWMAIQEDSLIPKKYTQQFEQEMLLANKELTEDITDSFYLFLADTFVFSIRRETILAGAPKLTPTVAQVIKELRETGSSIFLDVLLRDMHERILREKPDEHNNRVLRGANDTIYTDDDFKQLILTLLPLRDKLAGETKNILYALQMFVVNQEIAAMPSMITKEGYRRIYERYGLSLDAVSCVTIDPEVTDAEYKIFLNGRLTKIKMTRDENGVVRFLIEGLDK